MPRRVPQEVIVATDTFWFLVWGVVGAFVLGIGTVGVVLVVDRLTTQQH